MSKNILKVKAKKLGYIGLKRRAAGTVFRIEEKYFSPKWMTLMEGKLANGEVPAPVLVEEVELIEDPSDLDKSQDLDAAEFVQDPSVLDKVSSGDQEVI